MLNSEQAESWGGKRLASAMSALSYAPFRAAILLAVLTVAFIVTAPMPSFAAAEALDYRDVAQAIDMERMKGHMTFFSGLGSRVTGYAGSAAAADYIAEALVDYGLAVEIQSYSVTVPLERGASVSVVSPESTEIEAHALWPNYVQTSLTRGVKASLVYGGYGEMKDFDGKRVDGSIVLLEFNSQKNWLNAVNLGAKGLIFIAPSDTVSTEARAKLTNIPIYVPRVYVSREDGEYLKSLALLGEPIVEVKSMIQYETVVAKNVIGVVEGTGSAEDVIVIGAHYDTWSVVPALAPGAEDSAGVSALLELARYFSQHKPSRTIWFVALSGHWEALAGAREFAEEYYFDQAVVNGERKIWAFVGLDFSSETQTLGMIYRGAMLDYGSNRYMSTGGWSEFKSVLPRYNWYWKSMLDWVNAMSGQLGRSYVLENGFVLDGWWTSIPTTEYMLDSEPLAVARCAALTLRTTKDSYRFSWGHPFSTLDKVHLENLEPQVEASAGIAYSLANVERIDVSWSLVKPTRYKMGNWALQPDPAAGYDWAGLVTMRGDVLAYNYSRAWYDKVPNSLVVVTRLPGTNYPFVNVITYADENGTFEVRGLGMGWAVGSKAALTTTAQMATALAGVGYRVEAYVLNQDSGVIEYAPDLGVFGEGSLLFWANADKQQAPAQTVVFKAVGASLFDLIDPTKASALAVVDSRFIDGGYSSTVNVMEVYDFSTMSKFMSYGAVSSPQDSLAMVFVPPESRFIILFKTGYDRRITGMIVNATEASPEGTGYVAKPGEELRLAMTSQRFLNDFFTVENNRYGKLSASFVRGPDVEQALRRSAEYAGLYREAYSEMAYQRASGYSLAGWLWATTGYSRTMGLINDSATAAVFLFAVIVVSAFFIDRIVFSGGGIRRILNISLLVTASVIILSFLHPSLRMATNIFVGFLTVLLLFFFAIITGLLTWEAMSVASRLKTQVLGQHFAEKGRMSTVAISFPVGIEYIKKRKLRACLILVTIAVMTFGLTALTSTTFFTGVLIPQTVGPTGTQQLLVRKGLVTTPKDFLDMRTVQFVQSILPSEGVVSPRVWFYPQTVRSVEVGADITGPSGSRTVRAIVGLSTQEDRLNPILAQSLLGERSRWFTEGDYRSVVIDKSMAETIGAQVGTEVSLLGTRLTVVAIVDSQMLSAELQGIDGNAMTPLDPNKVKILCKNVDLLREYFNPLGWDQVVIVPYYLAVNQWGGNVAAIAVDLPGVRPDEVRSLARDISMLLDVQVYAAAEGKLSMFSRLTGASFGGWETVMLPLLIGAFIILNTMLGSMVERRSEIATFASLGLSPSGVVGLFLAEGTVYAVISVFVGYISGVTLNAALMSWSMLPPDFVANTSSTFVLIAMSVVVGITLLSTVYPALMASAKLVTPSMRRRWAIPTKPKGDEWTIPLPFISTSLQDTIGILRYIEEYFKGYTVETAVGFITRRAELDTSNLSNLKLDLEVTLPPYDAGLNQRVILESSYIEAERKYTYALYLTRLTGPRGPWVDSNPRFVDAFRKEFLSWRGLKPEDKAKYQKTEA